MSEKMTDEELSLILARIRTELGHTAESDLSAHIAALTAERDVLRVQLDGSEERGRMVFEAKNKMLDALRERVQALEADLRRMTGYRDNAAGLANASGVQAAKALADIAAIRQRAGDVSGFFRASGGVGAPGWLQRGLRFVIGDDVRPSAPPEAFTHEKGLDAGVFDEAAKGCGLCPGCTDENWADGDLCDARRTTQAERPAPKHDGPCAHGVPCGPTTPEAFATVRDWMDGAKGSKPSERRAYSALSLLERRMGAMARAASVFVVALERAGGVSWLGPEEKRAHDELRAALTDAPAVFTMEEVRNAGEAVAESMDPCLVALTDDEAEAYASGWARGARTVADRLPALRR